MAGKKRMLYCLIGSMVLLLSACGGGSATKTDPGAGGKEAPLTPEAEAARVANSKLELTFLYPPSGTEELFMARFGEQIKKKFPQYTLKFIPRQSDNYAALLGSKQPIDIMIVALNTTGTYLTGMGLESDISDLIKKYNYDLNKIEPSLIEIQRRMANGGIYGLPYTPGAMTFLFNKDLFDKFGVPYPRDNMTWDELYELARRMTRTDGGVQYKGIAFGFASVIRSNQLSAPYFDPKTNKAMFTDDRFVQSFANIARFYKIPGMELPNNKYSEQADLFLKDQTVAMMIHTGGYVTRTAEALKNWDIAAIPMLKEKPGVGLQAGPDYMYITNRSAQRDAAFQVLTYITSEEYQEWMTRNLAFVPVLKDAKKAMQSFGASVPGIQGKNVQALIQAYAPMSLASPFTANANSEMNNALNAFSAGKDVNTALREAAERLDKLIEQEMKK
ncbi:extracellular solute-binding protein [Paenibacillus mesophilus]|uniref:ABC transporter substrate-binding protein n=1 Tax=Paenibacillus mesophilus TaxID=2582849 RepID=UPI00110EE775|nr:extracellular solute-binding protein [Paenibacillus mesophilus]TMV45650.1 extracellular solute-binding protein [Paenibacillus mesophilus]